MLSAPEDPDAPVTVGDRRAAAADLHLLPPRAGARGAGGPDPAPARRAHRARGRERVPRARAHDGPADHPGEAQDRRRQHPLPGPSRPRAARTAAGRARRGLPRLHRGPPARVGGATASATTCAPRRSGSAGCCASSCPTSPRSPGCSPSCCSPTLVARRGWMPVARSSRSTARTAPSGTGRRSPRVTSSSGSACAATAPGTTSSSRRSTRCTPTRPRRTTPTGARCSRSTTSCTPPHPPRSSRSTGPSRLPRSRGRQAALAVVDGLPLDRYHPYQVTRADLLRRLGRVQEAAAAYDRALELATNPAERAFLARRRAELG